MSSFVLLSILTVVVSLAGQLRFTPAPSEEENVGRLTLGGTQFWTDQMVCHGWRIQKNIQFGQHRLLKPTNRVATTGTYEDCRQAFLDVFRQSEFPRIPSTVVVTIHGLGRTRKSMEPIGEYTSEKGDFGWINFGYASTRAEIADNAGALLAALNGLASLRSEQSRANAIAPSGNRDNGPIRFHFVGHSLGNILVRRVLHETHRTDRADNWRVGRIVMLGPPNQGSAMAHLLNKSRLFKLMAGTSGKDLGVRWNLLQGRLATPACEFAIIAGGKSDKKGYSPLLPGDDDLVVRVEETKLSGAADFAVVPSIHTYLMQRTEVMQMALRFLTTGALRAGGERVGIR